MKIKCSFFKGCSELTCSNKNHERCVESSSQGPSCECRRGFFDVNGECISGPVVINIIVRFTIVFNSNFSDRYHPSTIAFVDELKPRLCRAMELSSCSYLVIISISSGSTIVDFEVILPSNTTQTETTLMKNLENDIFNNSTQSLFVYFPTAPDPNNTILEINSKHNLLRNSFSFFIVKILIRLTQLFHTLLFFIFNFNV